MWLHPISDRCKHPKLLKTAFLSSYRATGGRVMLFFCGRNASSTARSGQKGMRNKSFPKIQKFTAIKSTYLKLELGPLGWEYVPSTTVSHREISWNPFNCPSMTWHFATSQELGAVSASKAKSPPGLGIIPNGFHVRSVQNLWIYTHNLKFTLGTSFFLKMCCLKYHEVMKHLQRLRSRHFGRRRPSQVTRDH